MRVQALAVAAGAVAVAVFGDVPVAVTVWSVAVLAESCIVVEPGGVDVGEGRGNRNALAICSALLASMGSPMYPFSVATPLKMRCHRSGSRCSRKKPCRRLSHCSHSAGSSPGATSSIRVDGDPHVRHDGAATIPAAMKPGYELARRLAGKC